MIIGRAAKASGLPPKTIRYYEAIGLIVPHRAENGYRDFADEQVRKLRFVRRARALGFPLDDCRSLLSAFETKSCAESDANQLADTWLADIDRKTKDLRKMRAALARLIEANDDEIPYRAIRDDLRNSINECC